MPDTFVIDPLATHTYHSRMCHALTQSELLIIADPPADEIDALLDGSHAGIAAERVVHWPGAVGWPACRHARRVSLRSEDGEDKIE